VLLRRLLGLVEQGQLLLLAGARLLLGPRAVDDQVQELDTLLKLGNMLLLVSLTGGHVSEEAFQRGRVVGKGMDIHSPSNMSVFFNLIKAILFK
jgi:hypothetical protein